MGVGFFQLFDGVVDHKLLGIHTTGTTTRLGFRASMRMRRAGASTSSPSSPSSSSSAPPCCISSRCGGPATAVPGRGHGRPPG
ncbi:DUF2243 domain-containing protein [Microbacterium sp. HSID17254]|uniref:DUF2243 domain-containing protein n=1 Tax=Microbacterium sp. HSID17254 TaxID=2419509 RepID=UPI00406C6279